MNIFLRLWWIWMISLAFTILSCLSYLESQNPNCKNASSKLLLLTLLCSLLDYLSTILYSRQEWYLIHLNMIGVLHHKNDIIFTIQSIDIKMSIWFGEIRALFIYLLFHYSKKVFCHCDNIGRPKSCDMTMHAIM